MSQRSLILNLVIRAQGSHAGGWRFTRTAPADVTSLGYYLSIARTAERGLFDTAFLTDTLSLSTDPVEALQWPLDPLVLMSAIAAGTSHLGLIVTHSTTFNAPFNTARMFASLDHLSQGRAGWNVVTSSSDLAAQNFGDDSILDHDERYRRAAEYLDATFALWHSWEPGAIRGDKATGTLVDTDAIHRVDVHSEHYRVKGPLNSPRSPQTVPLISQAGNSGPGRDLAARYADLVYSHHTGLPDAKAYADDVRARARGFGRDPDNLRFLPGVVPYVRSTEAEAKQLTTQLFELDAPEARIAKASDLLGVSLSSAQLDSPVPWDAIAARRSAWGKPAKVEQLLAEAGTAAAPASLRELVIRLDLRFQHRALIGTPEQVADYIEAGFSGRAFDGVSVIPPVLPEGIEDFVDHVVPILQQRGLHKTRYGEGTLRDRLHLPAPGTEQRGKSHYA